MAERFSGDSQSDRRSEDDPMKIIKGAIAAGDQATIERVVHQLRVDPFGANPFDPKDKRVPTPKEGFSPLDVA